MATSPIENFRIGLSAVGFETPKPIVLYTAITNSYDTVRAIKSVEPGIDYVCLVDEKFSATVPPPWKRVQIPKLSFKGKDLARFCKINAHDFFPEHRLTIWIDGSMGVNGSVLKFIETLPAEKTDLVACYEHWSRKSIREEMYACCRVPHDTAWTLRKQLRRYEREGYPDNELFETGVLVRRNTLSVSSAMKTWWSEYERGGKRDQYSFTYAMFKHGIRIFSLGPSDPRLRGEFFSYHEHVIRKRASLGGMALATANMAYLHAIGWNRD